MLTPELQAVSVSQVLTLCNNFFTEIGDILVEGEVANYSLSKGKYVFFDLKDETEESRIGCFMMYFQQNIPLEDGMRVQVRARLSIYQKSGQLRLIVASIVPQGEGSLKRAFDLLLAKLEKEGLFAPQRKRSIPYLPSTVGIISSENAAGYGDFMRIADTRVKGIRYILANVSVQGIDAETEIVAAFEKLNNLPNLDVIVLIRGGGSMEDLHAFNSELVARAIVRSRVPVITGIGHERDVTIADLCADLRASTPSNAAQLVMPEVITVVSSVNHILLSSSQRVARIIATRLSDVKALLVEIDRLMKMIIQNTATYTTMKLQTIDALSPTRILERGFTLTTLSSGKLLKSALDIKPGTHISTKFKDGSVSSITE